MMRKAYFGMNALFILAFHVVVMVLEGFELLPYSRTLFFPMLMLLALMLGILGWFERDKLKWPSIVASLIAGGMLTFWITFLIMRIAG